ncbi:MAG: T9SS type A sorting domain-containing protein [Bacteroidales bacterium]|nr:T9SS type A sorting domain-containing protein [Bacteroidales bacterium]
MKRRITIVFLACLLAFLNINLHAQVWEPVGNPDGISLGGVGRLTLVNDFEDNLVVGYYDASVEKASVQKYDGTNWSYLGQAGMTPSYATYNSLAVDNVGIPYFTNQAAYPEAGLEVRKFENGVWVDLPNAADQIINFQSSAFSADNTLFVVTGENSGTVKKFVNGTWEQVGTSNFLNDTPFYLDMAIANNGKIYISFNNNGFVHVFENNVNASITDEWLPVGGITDIAPAPATENYNSSLAVDGNSNLFLAYASSYNQGQKLNVKKFDGTEWSQLGNAQFSPNAVQYVSIAIGANNIVYVVASNWAEEDFGRNYVMFYNDATDLWEQAGTGWASMGEASFNSLEVNSNGNLFLAFSDSYIDKLSVKMLNLDIVAAESVEISTEGGVPAEITEDNGTLQLIATVLPENASQSVVWNIESGETFATVDENGLVTATTSNAVVTIRAFSTQNESIFDTFDVTITNQNSDIEAQEIVLTTENNVFSDILSIGGTLQLISTITPAEADQYVIWTVEEGSDIVSVNSEGLVTSLSEGYAIIRATCTENATLYDEMRINVWESGCSQGNESMVFGDGYTISNGFKVADDFIVEEGMRFSVGTIRMNILIDPDVDITSVDLHFLKNDVDRPGEEITVIYNITPTYQRFIADFDFVQQYEIELDLDETIMFEQGTYWLSPVATSSNGSDVYWDATVYGNIGYGFYSDSDDGHGWRGNGGMDAVFEITGNCTQMPVVVNTANGEDTEIYVEEELQLEAQVNEPDVSQDVIWSVESGSQFATVDENGLVIGIAVGVVVVRATSVDDNSLFGEIEISVIDPNTCGVSVPSNNLENGYLFGSIRLAVDIIVEEGYTFTITSVEPTVIDLATEFTFLFYKDEDGFPGDTVTATTTGTITHNTTTGMNFLYYFHRYHIELDTPVILEEGIYWMEIVTNAIGWESTSVSVIGHPGVFNNPDTGGEWQYSSNGSEYVYNVNGLCELVTSIPNNSLSEDNDIMVFPNPSDDHITLKINNIHERSIEVNIFDSLGRIVMNSNFNQETDLDISSLPSGIYYIKIFSEEINEIRKIIVN